MVVGKKLVIVMGAARSGTTWLQAMLAAHEQICTASELFLFHYATSWMEQWERHQAQSAQSVQIGLSVMMSRDDFLAHLRALVDDVYGRVAADHPEATVIVDKTPSYTHHVPAIVALVPDVHLIHIIRDGRDVVASTLAASRDWGRGWAMSNVGDAIEHWRVAVTKGCAARDSGVGYSEIRYETLLERGVEELQRIFTEIGIPLDREQAQAIYDAHQIDEMRKEYTAEGPGSGRRHRSGVFLAPKEFYRRGTAGGWKEDLNVFQRYQVFRTASETLCELGYASDENWWSANALQRMMIPWLSRFRGYLVPWVRRGRRYWGSLRRRIGLVAVGGLL